MKRSLDLAALQSRNIPRLNWRELFKADGLTPEDEKVMNEYFSRFAPPNEGKCLNCETLQGGLTAVLLGGGFRYGLAHGEGYCGRCGYPARANHYDVGPITRFFAILQYHPSELTAQTEEPNELNAAFGVGL